MAGERGRRPGFGAAANRERRRFDTLRPLALAAAAAAALAGSAAEARAQEPPAHPTSDRCMACHNGLATPAGEDVSFGTAWRATMMANSARDPYWQASVRRETLDHPEAARAIEGECGVCHMPLAHVRAMEAGREVEVFAHLRPGERDPLAIDGVSCPACHRITGDGLGEPSTFTGGFRVDPDRLFGPFRIDTGRAAVMASVTGASPTEGLHIQRSELCATCHTLYTNARGPGGEVIGRLPEQVPFLEWRHSAYRDERSCQSCHMPVVEDSVSLTSVLGIPRQGLSRHDFRGGNFFVLRMLARYREELGVAALPGELDAAAERTLSDLGSRTAALELRGASLREGTLRVDVAVTNLTGHKLPTAYPSRRAWLHVTVRDAGGRIVFESGAVGPDGAIAGNDADAGAARFEPHHGEIRGADQVQVYESVMADPEGRPTTGLLTAVRYLKDNRLLPRGFDKRTAGEDIAVLGAARQDGDFVEGGDVTSYVMDARRAAPPLRVEAELLFQPIAFRWAENLAGYDAPEPRRFVSWFRTMAGGSTATLARATVVVP